MPAKYRCTGGRHTKEEPSRGANMKSWSKLPSNLTTALYDTGRSYTLVTAFDWAFMPHPLPLAPKFSPQLIYSNSVLTLQWTIVGEVSERRGRRLILIALCTLSCLTGCHLLTKIAECHLTVTTWWGLQPGEQRERVWSPVASPCFTCSYLFWSF